MTVKETIAEAAGYLSREDLISALKKESSSFTESEREDIDSLLRCFNYTENEVALDYYPLKKEETLLVANNKIYFSRFSLPPVSIKKVLCGGKLTRFTAFPAYLALPDVAMGKADVTYSYLPRVKTLEESSDFTDTAISSRILALGIAAQYCFINGESGRSSMWEQRFREALRASDSLRSTLYVRSRRWL